MNRDCLLAESCSLHIISPSTELGVCHMQFIIGTLS